MTTYSIDDGHGNQITTGLQGYDLARQVARKLATRRGESVYLYATADEDDGEIVGPEEIVPQVAQPAGSQPKTSPGILAILEGR